MDQSELFLTDNPDDSATATPGMRAPGTRARSERPEAIAAPLAAPSRLASYFGADARRTTYCPAKRLHADHRSTTQRVTA
jgi:hypothetical protein